MLGAVLFWFYPRIALRSIIWLYLLSGFGIWISGQPNSYHIGASGIVYGMVSLVFWSGVFRRNVKSIVLALIILVMYAGFFEGIVPGKEGISWEGHLSGAIAGILLAFVYRRDVEEDEVVPEVEEEIEERHYYLPRDTFDMTMAERRALWESRNEQGSLSRQSSVLSRQSSVLSLQSAVIRDRYSVISNQKVRLRALRALRAKIYE
jgi:hypothetical protein